MGEVIDETQISNFMKIRVVGAQLLHVDLQDEAESSSSQFCERF